MVIDSLMQLLSELLPTLPIDRNVFKHGGTIEFPVPNGAEFQLTVIFDPAEAEIRARRIGALAEEHFWYHAFEDAAYSSENALSAALAAELRTLLTCPVQVRLRRRWVTCWEFTCAAQCTPDEWQPLHSYRLMRFGRIPPHHDGHATWYSPAISGIVAQ